MTPTELISDLAERGICLKVQDGRLMYFPYDAVSDDLLALMRQHKASLMRVLTVPSHWDEYDDAIARAFANPTNREEVGPLYLTNPDGFGPICPHDPPLRHLTLATGVGRTNTRMLPSTAVGVCVDAVPTAGHLSAFRIGTRSRTDHVY